MKNIFKKGGKRNLILIVFLNKENHRPNNFIFEEARPQLDSTAGA